jgi:1-acyl-sn-glycerol-3-phosphate acyltransferase
VGRLENLRVAIRGLEASGESMWAVLVVAVGAGLLLLAWLRSGATWFDYSCLLLTRVYVSLWHRWSCKRPAPIPPGGAAILISNHTCSADPMFLQCGIRRTLSYLVAAEHYGVHPIVRWILDNLCCVAVERSGRDVGAVRKALARLRDGRIVCLFPEGNLSGVARNRLRAAKHGAALLALRSRAPVYPAYVEGGPRTSRLLQSWVRPSRRAVRVHYGPAIDLSAYHGRPRTRQVLEEVSALLMRHVEALRPK